MAGAVCVSGVTDSGVDLGQQHDTLIQEAMAAQAKLYGPQSLAATFSVARRSVLSHVLEMAGDLWTPHSSIAVGAAATAAPQPAAGDGGPSGGNGGVGGGGGASGEA